MQTMQHTNPDGTVVTIYKHESASIGVGASIGARASIGESASIGARASIGESSIFLANLGRSLQNNAISLVRVNGALELHVGCRRKTLADARVYWGAGHRNQKTASYMLAIVDHAENIAKFFKPQELKHHASI